MRIGDRISVGFDKTFWVGAGIFWATETLWIDFLGFYFNLYFGKVVKD